MSPGVLLQVSLDVAFEKELLMVGSMVGSKGDPWVEQQQGGQVACSFGNNAASIGMLNPLL